MDKEKKIKIYAASKILQNKVGSGPLDEKLIEKAQKLIEENDVDFTPLGLEFLEKLKETLEEVTSNQDSEFSQEVKDELAKPVMTLKANASIFHYPLVGELAKIMLDFIETIKILDKDAIDIVSAHHDTLYAIIKKKMRGDDGLKQGEAFITELKEACARYFKKRQTTK